MLQSRFEVTLSSRKRSNIDIIASILGEARRGSRKTGIMYRCNLSYKQLEVYLKLLLGMEFLVSRSDLFITTAKGLKFLEAYRVLKELMRVDTFGALKDSQGVEKEAESGRGNEAQNE